MKRFQISKLLIDAIEQRRIIELMYDGFYHKVEPYIYGVYMHSSIAVMAYQIAEESKNAIVPAWKNFFIDKIESLKVMEQTFLPNQRDYNPHNQRFKKIFAKII